MQPLNNTVIPQFVLQDVVADISWSVRNIAFEITVNLKNSIIPFILTALL